MAKILTFLLLLGKLSSHTGQILGQHKFYFVVLKTRWGDILFLRLLLLFGINVSTIFGLWPPSQQQQLWFDSKHFSRLCRRRFHITQSKLYFMCFSIPKSDVIKRHLDNKSSLGIVMEFVWNNIYARVCSFDLNKFFSVSDVFCKIGSLIASF